MSTIDGGRFSWGFPLGGASTPGSVGPYTPWSSPGADGADADATGAAADAGASASTLGVTSSLFGSNDDLRDVLEGTRTLAYGARGEDVRAVQLALLALGRDLGPGGADGLYGRGTERLVAELQRSQGLSASGQIDAATLRELDRAYVSHDRRDGVAGGTIFAPGLRGDSVLAEVAQGRRTLGRGAGGAPVEALQRALAEAGVSIRPDGDYGPGTERAVKLFQQAHGIEPATGTVDQATLVAIDRVGAKADWGWAPNAQALATARASGLGRRLEVAVPLYAEHYRNAERLTGVPAALVAAVHANESWMQGGSGARGPESGFGLDDRFVSTAWGNEVLAKHGLGPWERGTGTARSIEQSAIVAASHLQRMARIAGVEVRHGMSQNDVAGLTTAYMAGTRAGRAAARNGKSWAFDPADANPHPRHPGGTSRGPGGQTIPVAPARKEGLLRWDVLVPLVDEHLAKR